MTGHLVEVCELSSDFLVISDTGENDAGLGEEHCVLRPMTDPTGLF